MANGIATKHCPRCCQPNEKIPIAEFSAAKDRADGYRAFCKSCDAKATRDRVTKRVTAADAEDAKTIQAIKDRARRIASDTESLTLADFEDAGIANGKRDPNASRDKRQEFNRSMAANAEALRRAAVDTSNGSGDVLSNMPGESGTYIGKLAEQERRFGNRRLARSVSLAQAQEALSMRHFALVAEQCFSGKVVPTGYAKTKSSAKIKRSVCLLLSDLHLGSDLSALDNPMPFRAVEEARRLEYIMRQVIDYKPQYRNNTELVLLLNGDLIDGLLMHDFRDGAPLTEQKAIFWHLMSRFVGECARAFPSVRVECQPGNHGRNIVRHPGRATSRKWDGHEWELYFALSKMCSSLKNVTWSIPFRAISAINLHGSIVGMTHGDTEVKISHPDQGAKNNAREFDRINATQIYGVVFDAWLIGHFHTPRYSPGNPHIIYNGALIPPNGYARTSGYIGESAGQFLWEATEGYPIGDLRFIDVGRAQDEDDKLGTILQPFRFPTS